MSFKLPDFLSWPSLDILRQKMNAPLTTNFSLKPMQSDSSFAEKLLSGGIEINLDEVKVHNDGTLICNNKRVLLHIRDVSSIAGEYRMPKYHLANCQVLETMRRNSRFGRYVVANRDTGEFQVNIMGSDKVNQTVKLNVCQSCLDKIHWHGFSVQGMTGGERLKRVADFSLTDFFKDYPRDLIVNKPLHTSMTAPLNDYPKNWGELSKSIRQKRGYQCECCERSLSKENSRFLHVHHLNGLKNDNRSENLVVLCIACHAQQPQHGHLKAHPDYKLFMASQKI
jgi:HNH endonuclease.